MGGIFAWGNVNWAGELLGNIYLINFDTALVLWFLG
jgi:hypothetical protein